VIPEFVLTTRTLALAVVAGIGLFFVLRAVLAVSDAERDGDRSERRWYRGLAISGAIVGVGLVVASLLPDTAILTLTRVWVEPIVLMAALPLAYLALGVFASRDPRRYVIGFVAAAVAWGVVLYPNISALPLPSTIVNAYQGILPTYLYAFQFPVSTIDRTVATPLLTPEFALLVGTLTVTCLVVAYSAWVWRLSLAEPDESEDTETLARVGGA
jgi:cytochrome bd-type quinol oxidase subunit 2